MMRFTHVWYGFSFSAHLQTALSTLERGQSVFVQKEAENFLVESLTHSFKAHATSTRSPLSYAMVVNTVQFLSATLTDMTKGRASLLNHMIVSPHISAFHESVAQIVLQLSTRGVFCGWKAGDRQWMTCLAQLALQHPSEKIRQNTLQALVNLVAFM